MREYDPNVYGYVNGKPTYSRDEHMKKFPKYVKTYDGYIGVFSYLDFGEFPVYRFPGGERIADQYELEHGSDNLDELK